MAKDKVIITRSAFPPDFSKALAYALAKNEAKDVDIRSWIDDVLDDAVQRLTSNYYAAKREGLIR